MGDGKQFSFQQQQLQQQQQQQHHQQQFPGRGGPAPVHNGHHLVHPRQGPPAGGQPQPAPQRQPLYANAPPKPRRLNTSRDYTPSPEPSPERGREVPQPQHQADPGPRHRLPQERRTPEAYGRSRFDTSQGQGRVRGPTKDYEEVYNNNNHINNSHSQHQEQLEHEVAAYNRVQQRAAPQHRELRPHSADFLEYELRHPASAHAQQPREVARPRGGQQPARPKSCIGDRVRPEEFWSEAAYAQKMRESSFAVEQPHPPQQLQPPQQRSQSRGPQPQHYHQQQQQQQAALAPPVFYQDQRPVYNLYPGHHQPSNYQHQPPANSNYQHQPPVNGNYQQQQPLYQDREDQEVANSNFPPPGPPPPQTRLPPGQYRAPPSYPPQPRPQPQYQPQFEAPVGRGGGGGGGGYPEQAITPQPSLPQPVPRQGGRTPTTYQNLPPTSKSFSDPRPVSVAGSRLEHAPATPTGRRTSEQLQEGARWDSADSGDFRRSASARLPKQKQSAANTTLSGESDDSKRAGEAVGREESMKRLLNWKQRMLQSPLTRKSSRNASRTQTPTNSDSPVPSLHNEDIRKRVLEELQFAEPPPGPGAPAREKRLSRKGSSGSRSSRSRSSPRIAPSKNQLAVSSDDEGKK